MESWAWALEGGGGGGGDFVLTMPGCVCPNMKDIGPFLALRLDNTGAWVMEVYPSLLCNLMSENYDLYIKLKLGIYSFI